MNRSQKEEWVQDLKSSIQEASLVVVTKQDGINVSEITDLRFQMKENNANFKVVKNTLAKLALKDGNISKLVDFFTGPCGIAYSKDPIAAAKVVVKFSESNNKMQVLAGVMNGIFMNASQIKALAKLPSLNELRGTLVGLISAPATKMVRIFSEPAAKLSRVIFAHSSNKESKGE